MQLRKLEITEYIPILSDYVDGIAGKNKYAPLIRESSEIKVSI
jgi:hypothetical protein